MLQVIVSPAKQMRAAQDAFEVQGIPPFARETAQLHHALLDIERTEGDSGLQALWNVSDKLLAPCLDILHEFEPILGNGDLDNPALARHLSPRHHVLSRHSVPEHGTRGDGFSAARMAARPSVDPLRPLRVRSSLPCRRTVSTGDGREARR